MPGVWIGRLKGAKEIQCCYGPIFLKDTLIETKNQNIKHYFMGEKSSS